MDHSETLVTLDTQDTGWRKKNTKKPTKLEMIDNIFVHFYQSTGIAMDTMCTPFLADLALYSYESDL